MKKKSIRFLSWLLVFVMALTLLPMAALAEELETPAVRPVTEAPSEGSEPAPADPGPAAELTATHTYETNYLKATSIESGAQYIIQCDNKALHFGGNNEKTNQCGLPADDTTASVTNGCGTKHLWKFVGDNESGYTIANMDQPYFLGTCDADTHNHISCTTGNTTPAKFQVTAVSNGFQISWQDSNGQPVYLNHIDGNDGKWGGSSTAATVRLFKAVEPNPWADAPVLPGYTRVTAIPDGGLNTDTPYLIVAQDTSGNAYALYAKENATNPGSLPNKNTGTTSFAASLSVSEGVLSVTSLASSLEDLHFTLTKSGSADNVYTVSHGSSYLNMHWEEPSDHVGFFSTTSADLTFTLCSGGEFDIKNGTRHLDFNKGDDPHTFGEAYGTEFWGPRSRNFPIYLYAKDATEPDPGPSTVVTGEDLPQMFQNDPADGTADGQNSWVITGGRVAQGGYQDVQGARSYAGHFEEYIRSTQPGQTQSGSDKDRPGLQRHVINAAYAGQTLAELVTTEGWKRITDLDPRAVAYMVESGGAAEEDFADNLKVLIGNALALRDNTGMIVIQTLTAEDKAAVDAVLTELKAADTQNSTTLCRRILAVQHTLTADQMTDNYPNAQGHLELAKQLAKAATGSSSAPSLFLSGAPLKADFPNDNPSTTRTYQGTVPETLSAPQNAVKSKVAGTAPMTWLFMGDSITHGSAWTFGYDSVSQLFEKFVKEDLGRTRDVVINAGSSGATTATTVADLTKRLEKYSPDVVAIQLGTNDAAGHVVPVEDYQTNLRTILDKVLEKQAVPVLRTPVPNNNSGRGEFIHEYADAMKAVAAEEAYAGKVIVVDQFEAWWPLLMSARDGTATTGLYSKLFWQNLHPNPAGHLWMVHQLIEELGLWSDSSTICGLEYVAMAEPEIELPGYKQVKAMPEGGLSQEKYYIIVSQDSDGGLYALRPNVTTAGCGNLTARDQAARYAVALTVNGQTVTANHITGTTLGDAVDVSTLRFTVEPAGTEGSQYVIRSGETYLDLNTSVFAGGAGPALDVSFNGGTFVIHNTAPGRFLDFNKQGDAHEFSNNNGTYGTDFWGPNTVHFPSYLMEELGAVPPTARENLQAKVDEIAAEDLDAAGCTPATWNVLEAALEAAGALLADDAVPNNDQRFKDALAVLRDARNGLQPAPAQPELPGAVTVYLKSTGTLTEGEYQINAPAVDDGARVLHYHDGHTNQCRETASGDELPLSEDVAGAHRWIIKAEADGSGYTISPYNDQAKYLNKEPVSDSNAQRAVTTTKQVVTIEPTGTGGYYIKWDDNTYLNFSSNAWRTGSEQYELLLFKKTEKTPQYLEWQDMVPEPGETQDLPFAAGTGGSQNFRIPSILSLKYQTDESKNGRLLAAIDARWNWTNDACSLDTIVSYSDDGGQNWRYLFPNYFGDSTDVKHSNGTAFIDPVMVEGRDGTVYMMVDLYPGGVAINSAPLLPAAASGYVEIGGKQRLVLYTTNSPTDSQTDANYSYYVGDFDADGYAPIYDSSTGEKTAYYIDAYYYLYQGDGADRQADKLWCPRLGSSDIVQQNLFFHNACLHVRNASYLWLITSTDGGESWSKPVMLNPMVRTGNDIFYGVGPGVGLSFVDGTGREIVMLPVYTYGRQVAGFVYSTDGGATWKRGNDAAPASWWTSESCLVQLDETTARHFYRDGDDILTYTDHTWDPATQTWTTGERVSMPNVRNAGNNQMCAIRYSQELNGKTVIVLSSATGDTSQGTGNNYRRRHGKLYLLLVNDDKTMELGGVYEVNGANDAYNYSCIAETPSGDIALLYEAANVASTFQVIPWADFTKVPEVTAEGYTGVQDGEAHGITVTSTGAVKYSLVDGGPYYEQNFTFTDPGTYTVYYQVADATGTFFFTDSEQVVITSASTGGSTGGSSGGSGGPASTTTTNPDGTTTTTTIIPGGAISQTTPQPDGSTLQTVIEPDGTVTRTVTQPDGSAVSTTTALDGTVTTATKGADGLEVAVTTKPDADTAVSVTLPAGMDSATVTVPTDGLNYGLVAVDAATGAPVTMSIPTEGGLALQLDGSADLVLVDRAKQFIDVENHWAEDAIDFTTARDLFQGTSEITFSPEDSMTRAMVVTLLARFDGVDTSAGATWYEAGAQWAMDQGVSDGTDLASIATREQIITMLWRYAGSPEATASLDRFSDAADAHSYTVDALRWAVQSGILKGFDDGTLMPQGRATRAQASALMLRFCQYLMDA